MSTAFDYIKYINTGEQSKVDGDYSPYLTDIFFSLFADTILHANRMNVHRVEGQRHFDYMVGSVRPRKRFKKWPKKRKGYSDDLYLIMHFYKYSSSKAKEVLAMLSEEQIAAIKKQTEVGVI